MIEDNNSSGDPPDKIARLYPNSLIYLLFERSNYKLELKSKYQSIKTECKYPAIFTSNISPKPTFITRELNSPEELGEPLQIKLKLQIYL
ncbi:MAG: hypothetical protein RLZZ135_2140 [Cyanobacteriota bacterium]|jgi:hypothetical protein